MRTIHRPVIVWKAPETAEIETSRRPNLFLATKFPMQVKISPAADQPDRSDAVPEVGELELSIVMPCLNEAETLATCICKAQSSLEKLNISGEVIIADNGSTDGSHAIA